MNHSERDQFIIDRYQAGEDQMILLFVQWCHNHEFDPLELYREAYPNQVIPAKLVELNDGENEQSEALEIETGLLLEVLQVYSNDDLAFVVANYAEKKTDK